MNSRVRAIIEKVWEQRRSQEIDMIEGVYKSLGSPCRFLEVGCGRLGLLSGRDKLLNLSDNSFGLDVDFDALFKNEQVVHKICADCTSLPIRSKKFNIVVARWLFEHLKTPEIVLQEISRILTNNGYLFITTPNLYNYITLVSRFTPLHWHNVIRRKCHMHDNIPSYYRANTRARLKRLALQNNLVVKYCFCVPNSFLYYRFNKYLFFIMMIISNFLSRFTSKFHLKMICLMQKKADL